MNKEKKSELIKTLGWSGLTCFGGLGAFRYADVADQFVAVAIFLVIIYFVFRIIIIFNI